MASSRVKCLKCLTIETCNIETAIQLLYSPEESVVTNAIIALNRFAMHSEANLKDLSNLKILNALRHLLEHPDIKIVKLALKLLVLLVNIPGVIKTVKSDKILIGKIVDFLKNTTDEIFHEYSTAILVILSNNDLEIVQHLYRCDVLDILWQHVKWDMDLDILNSCLQILFNMACFNNAVKDLMQKPNFNLDVIVLLLPNEHQALGENALRLCKRITSTKYGEELENVVKKSSHFFAKLFELLENTQFTNFHAILLEILLQIFKWENLIVHFIDEHDEFLAQFLKFVEENKNLGVATICIDIITKLASIRNGCHTLYMLYADHFLMKYLIERKTALDEIGALKTCAAINAMVKHEKAVKTFTNATFLRALCALLPTKAGDNWLPDKLFIIEILTWIVWSNVQVPEIFTDLSIFSYLLKTIEHNAKIMPAEYFGKLLRLLQSFPSWHKWREFVQNLQILDLLRKQLSHESDYVKIVTLEVISSLLSDEISIKWCLTSECYKQLFSFLESDNNQLVFASIELINYLCKYPEVAFIFIHQKLLSILQSRSRKFQHYPIWKNTIDCLYNAHLPTKFHHTGCLGITDITGDHFYVTKHAVKDLPILDDLLKIHANPLETLYVSQLTYKKPTLNKLKPSFSEADLDCLNKELIPNAEIELQRQYRSAIFKMDEKSKKSCQLKTRSCPALLNLNDKISCGIATKECSATILEIIAPQLISWLSCLSPDPYIAAYIKYLKHKLTHANLLCRISFLAQFVANQMSGPSDRHLCLTQDIQMDHLNQLKRKYCTNIIPIGFVRIGGYLERAMLFKVLSDCLQIPCTLERGNQGIVWNEVAIVGTVCDDDSRNLTMCNEGPVILYVVDLMNNPGKLYPKYSHFAEEYCNINTGCLC